MVNCHVGAMGRMALTFPDGSGAIVNVNSWEIKHGGDTNRPFVEVTGRGVLDSCGSPMLSIKPINDLIRPMSFKEYGGE